MCSRKSITLFFFTMPLDQATLEREGLSNANKMLTQDSGMANGSGPLMKGDKTLRISAAHLF